MGGREIEALTALLEVVEAPELGDEELPELALE
jgi:hypothetical protein